MLVYHIVIETVGAQLTLLHKGLLRTPLYDVEMEMHVLTVDERHLKQQIQICIVLVFQVHVQYHVI